MTWPALSDACRKLWRRRPWHDGADHASERSLAFLLFCTAAETGCSPHGDSWMSTIEDNKRIAMRWFELVTQGRVEELCAMTAPTWTMHGGPCRCRSARTGSVPCSPA